MCKDRNFGMSSGCVGEMPKGPFVEKSAIGGIISDVAYVSSLKAEIQELKADKLKLDVENKKLLANIVTVDNENGRLGSRVSELEGMIQGDKTITEYTQNLIREIVELRGLARHLENQLKSTKVCSCENVTSLEKEAYLELERVLRMAYDQAASGKGKDRHANGKPFVDQPILSITRMVGDGYPLGQAMKKAQETQRLPANKAKIVELLGAINYLAAAIIYYEEQSL